MSTRARRDFEALTPRGQRGRLRSLALDALGAYDLEVARCSFVASAFNTVFRVETVGGESYALRTSPELRIHADGCEELEARWAAALRRDAGIEVPRVILTRDGSVLAWTERAGVPGARSSVLFEWVRGRRLRERLRPDLAHKTGSLAARVHEHGAGYALQAPSGALGADRVLYFRVAERLGELAPAYGSALTDALDRAQAALDDLWRSPPHAPHLLHGDVQPGNVMVNRGDVTLIDFQDLIWGFEIQDVTFTLLSFASLGDTGPLGDAFRAGYETIRPWPDAEPATVAAITAARHLNILNFGLHLRRPGLDPFVARHAVPVIDWMRS